jgi:plasmid stabilization system protein ParE
MRIKLLKRARRDIDLAVSYLAENDPPAINGFSTAIYKSLMLIMNNPNVGRPVNGRPTRLWSVPHWPYVIPYRIIGDTVEVLRIWHTKRDRPDEW